MGEHPEGLDCRVACDECPFEIERAFAASTGAEVKVVMARCPYRGQSVSTGIEIEEATFSRLPDTLILSRCPLCGLEHVWWKTEAWLEDARYDKDADGPAG
ncbi:hypothetical protein [Rhodoplanes roseus]|uniref:hypothetical protein n=1 Tax=Rhodoplanes roseus TaxID=29409 RepID=UPI001AECBAD4|nr:hypothetical protein [Rhodoplanes roseus]